MYIEHFGLRERPFTITPDTAFFLNLAGHQDALNILLVALRSGEGFVKVTGEVGTGKTLLCRTLINTLGDDFRIAYIPNPSLDPTTLMLTIADELGVEYPEDIHQHGILKRINQALFKFHGDGLRIIVCLDEVQAMPVSTLETLRLLSNLETEKTKLIQVVLFGQPELDTVLAAPAIRQLRQRITFSCHLLPLDHDAVGQYISHRLTVAGYDGPALFYPEAIALIARASGGIPRLINIIAHKSMLAAYGKGEPRIKRHAVRAAVRDTEDARHWRRGPSMDISRWITIAAILVVCAAGFAIGSERIMAWLP